MNEAGGDELLQVPTLVPKPGSPTVSQDAQARTVEAHAVVLVTARTPLDGLYKEISGQLGLLDSGSMDPGSVPTLKKIGDCDAPAIIAAAVYAGHRYARELETEVADPVDVRYDRLFDKE